MRGTITWIGGAIAGLTALCYGAGYFSLQSYLSMLGLSGIVDIRTDQMLTEGSRFWLQLLSILLRYAALSVVVLIFAIILVALLRESARLRLGWAKARGAAGTGWGWTTRKLPQAPSLAALLTLFVVLRYHYDSYFDALVSLGRMRELLFVTLPGGPVGCDALITAAPTAVGRVAGRLMQQGAACTPAALNEQFAYLIQGYFLLIPMCLIAFGDLARFISQSAALICRVAIGAYFGVFTLTLPNAYGTLKHEPVYPRVTLSGSGLGIDGYRLAQDTSGLLVWLPDQRTVQWVPLRRIDEIRSGRPANLFRREEKAR